MWMRSHLTRIALEPILLLACLGCSQVHTPPAPRDQAPPTRAGAEDSVRVAGIVLKWITADKMRNYQRAVPLIREAAAKGAQIVVTTECFLDGYAIRDKTIPIEQWRALGEEIPGGSYLKRLQTLADELDIHLVAGMVERAGRRTYNAAVFIGPQGELIGKYRKQRMRHELVRNTPGDESPVFDTPFGKVGLMICADRRDPDLVRRLADNGADLILCPSGGMWGPVKNDHHLQARSRENQVPIVFVHPIEFLVTGPDGAILDRRFVGRRMSVEIEQIGGPADEHLVAVYDLPLGRQIKTTSAATVSYAPDKPYIVVGRRSFENVVGQAGRRNLRQDLPLTGWFERSCDERCVRCRHAKKVGVDLRGRWTGIGVAADGAGPAGP